MDSLSPFTRLALPSFDRYLRSLASHITADPGLPVANPTRSFWLSPPSQISRHQSAILPTHADVAIVGSGITGTSVARTLLALAPSLRVAMFDARDACSGATGRNGGHVKDSPYQSYGPMKGSLGKDKAMEVTRFRNSQLGVLMKVAEEEGLMEECQVRKVEGVDIFFDEDSWVKNKQLLEVYLGDFGEGEWNAWEGDQARKKFSSPHAIGAITGPAGALWPSRLITGILSRLLTSYPTFTLDTCTPVQSITTSAGAYTLSTPRGTVTATHVVHATNGHAAHLLPGLRGALFPVRGHMVAHTLSPSPQFHSHRSWQVNWDWSYDYATQIPDSQTLILGGGLVRSLSTEVGTTDDSEVALLLSAHLRGVVPAVFNAQTVPVAEWSGIMGFSGDYLQWVGEVPVEIAGRQRHGGGGGGKEWVAAGYSGEGMVNAWGCGEWLSREVLGMNGGEGVVGEMGVSVERAEMARKLEGFATEILGMA